VTDRFEQATIGRVMSCKVTRINVVEESRSPKWMVKYFYSCKKQEDTAKEWANMICTKSRGRFNMQERKAGRGCLRCRSYMTRRPRHRWLSNSFEEIFYSAFHVYMIYREVNLLCQFMALVVHTLDSQGTLWFSNECIPEYWNVLEVLKLLP